MKIIVCYDSSKSGGKALGLTRTHARTFNAEEYVVTSKRKTSVVKDKDLVQTYLEVK